jgi:hypothetical protein
MLTPDDNSIKSRKDDYNQFMIAGGNQAPELEIQHEMNHFPRSDFSIKLSDSPDSDYES